MCSVILSEQESVGVMCIGVQSDHGWLLSYADVDQPIILDDVIYGDHKIKSIIENFRIKKRQIKQSRKCSIAYERLLNFPPLQI